MTHRATTRSGSRESPALPRFECAWGVVATALLRRRRQTENGARNADLADASFREIRTSSIVI
jgi:hypothetical protein